MDDLQFDFINKLNDKQKEVCKCEDNVILTACPGSGKTRTLTYRLAYIYLKNKPSKKLNVAITYTNRAAEEIKKRINQIDNNIDGIWVGTIHQFCLEFIIRPYSMYCLRLRKGFHIIDEYVQRKYLNEIVSELGMGRMVGYDNPLDFPIVRNKYVGRLIDNKEIDFDDILTISYQLLIYNKFIRENISGIIRSIHVDEYQDTNELQYKILSEIIKENKDINILFVGDLNQAIYSDIGGGAKSKIELESEFEVKFVEKRLDGCYRSSQKIIDYYSNFQEKREKIYSFSENKDSNGIIYFDRIVSKNMLFNKIADIVNEQLDKGIKENEICILAPQWSLLYPLTGEMKKLLSNVNFDAPDITPIKYDPLNVFYNIAVLFLTQASDVKENWRRRKCSTEVINILIDMYNINIDEDIDSLLLLKYVNSFKCNENNGIVYLKKGIDYLFLELGIKLKDEVELEKAYNDFFDKISDRIIRYNLECDIFSIKNNFKEKTGVVINTFHGVKGEEYKTVIAFGLLRGYIPFWNSIINKTEEECTSEANKLLYVVCSRAKENIYLFAEQDRHTRRGNDYEVSYEMMNYKYEYNKI